MTKPKKPIKQKEPGVEQMFEDRMLREGKWDQYEKAKAEANAAAPPVEGMAEKILRGKAVKLAAMNACGFVSRDHERALYRQFKEQTERQEKGRVEGASSKTFEEALKSLPLKAEPQIENDWVIGHAAMARKMRQSDPDKNVIITGTDLLNSDHGPCPSRAAANKLQYWANEPKLAFAALTNPMKKGDRDSDRDAGLVLDDDIQDIERLLKEVGGVE